MIRESYMCLITCLLGTLALTQACSKDPVMRFQIAGGEASSTLRVFAKQASIDILIDEGELNDTITNEVNGYMSMTEALEEMLSGTDLD